jgi:hypothetical protein
MDGFETRKSEKIKMEEPLIIALTAAMKGDREEILNAGAQITNQNQ